MRSTAPFAVSAAPAEALKPLVGDVKRLSSKSLWAELDDKFRDFSMMSMSSFAPDEFDEEEQRLLIKFLRILEKWGYSRVFQRLMHSQGGQRIIDTAAGYGEFVHTEDCVSYLGIFIAAEAVQYPFAMDSYGFSMIRSACFGKLDYDAKIEILSLMHLARFIREIDLSTELELDMYGGGKK